MCSLRVEDGFLFPFPSLFSQSSGPLCCLSRVPIQPVDGDDKPLLTISHANRPCTDYSPTHLPHTRHPSALEPAPAPRSPARCLALPQPWPSRATEAASCTRIPLLHDRPRPRLARKKMGSPRSSFWLPQGQSYQASLRQPQLLYHR